jgi:hypothetical protein
MRLAILTLTALIGLSTTVFGQESKSESITYTGQITKLDKKNKTMTIKGPAGGLIPEAPPPSRGRGSSAPPAGRRGSRGAAGSATPRGPDMRVYEDVETRILWTSETEVESSDGKLQLTDLKVGDYVLVDTTKDGKKIRAVKIKRTNAVEG